MLDRNLMIQSFKDLTLESLEEDDEGMGCIKLEIGRASCRERVSPYV